MALKIFSLLTQKFFGLRVKSYFFYQFRNFNKNTVSKVKMNNLYIVNEKENDKVYIQILYRDESYNITKNLTFQRSLEETINLFLERFKVKINALYEIKKKKKMKILKHSEETEILNIPTFEPQFLLNNEPMSRNILLKDMITKMSDAEIKIRLMNADYPVMINAPLILDMSLPKELYIGTTVFPKTFDSLCVDLDKSIFTWYIKGHKKTWSKCGEGYYFVPKADDCGCFLKLHCTPVSCNLKEGLDYEAENGSIIETFNVSSELESRHELTKNPTTDDEIRIVSYNILADTYVNTKQGKTVLFTYCEKSFLDLNYRKRLLEIELTGYNADLICLQEMENKFFNNFFLPIFSNKGFDGVKLDEENRGIGCSFFYNLKKFKLLFSKEYYLHNELQTNPALKDISSEILKNQKLMWTISETKTLIQIGALECLKKENQIILFANAHLPYCLDYDHIRLLFGVVIIKLLLKVSEDLSKNHPGFISIIFCGDFNSTPESGLHKFLNEGSIDSSHKDWKSREGEFIENMCCSHPLKLQSAYGFPSFTNYTELFKGCLDYIYFQTDQLEVKQIVPIPSETVLSEQTAIPSEYFPSDHVSLVADLKFKV